jgi:pimeloyl-ACP methyl ester carboxylesterase
VGIGCFPLARSSGYTGADQKRFTSIRSDLDYTRPPEPWEARVVTTTSADGTDVRAADEGQGPPVLVVGPGMDDGSAWQRVAVRLAPRFRVVSLRRRRYRMDITTVPPCTIADEADDVLAVAKSIGGPVLLVGHSSGAVVALEALVAAPTLFAGAVLYEPPVHLRPSEWRESVELAAAAVSAGREGKAMAIFSRDILRLSPLVARASGLLVGLRPRWRALAARQIDDADAIDALGVRLAAYSGIEVPTVLLTGARTVPHLGERIDALARALPHADKVVLARQGHGANRTAPGEVARVIETLAGTVLRQQPP